MSHLMFSDGRAQADRLKVSIIEDVMTISLCGMTWAGSEVEFEELTAAFQVQLEAARTHQAVMESMLPPGRSK